MSVDTSNATAAAGVDPSRTRVTGAIKQASDSTGASFEYLLATASPAAAATTAGLTRDRVASRSKPASGFVSR